MPHGLSGIRSLLMPDIILSICIPTYNRGRILYENIKNWLKTSNQNFEIIVSDNCSDDNTLELLNSIDDNRLVILTNEKNMGGFINGNRTLLSGRGKYLMYLTDKDLISMEYFDDIIETLKNNDFANLSAPRRTPLLTTLPPLANIER